VHSIEAGKSATYDTALKPGWRQIVAVKEKDRLKLYVDGALVATSSQFDPAEYDLTNDKPLQIGFGAHDYFNGNMKDVKLYRRALSADEVRKNYTGSTD
ncbi:MAG: LamG domain-containing protein, partial [Planctomycetaceae bacterium]|nr:LamG domain-containing protein [Planctomycetaceae bacterium]